MKRITRDRRLTPEEAARYREVREQIAGELPDLVARHQERVAVLDELEELFRQLKVAREERGLSLSDLTELTGMDRSALSKLETGQRPIPRSRPWCATRKPSASGWSSRWPTLEPSRPGAGDHSCLAAPDGPRPGSPRGRAGRDRTERAVWAFELARSPRSADGRSDVPIRPGVFHSMIGRNSAIKPRRGDPLLQERGESPPSAVDKMKRIFTPVMFPGTLASSPGIKPSPRDAAPSIRSEPRVAGR